MIAIQFLVEWALRSSILVLSGALLLWMLRVKDSAVRSAVWTGILCGSLMLPALTAVLPALPMEVSLAKAPMAIYVSASRLASPDVEQTSTNSRAAEPFDWARAALAIYVLGAFALLLRLGVGLAMSSRLLRRSRATDRTTERIAIRESDLLAAPVTLGLARPLIVLPGDWRDWDSSKLEAVLAHERSHIRRYDPAVQLLSTIHRALLWHSPLSWFLHRRIVRVAEEVSDDAAIAATRDRAFYAELLLEFIQQGVRGARWYGVQMARYGRAEDRIHRVLDKTALSCGITWRTVAVILAMGSPLTYVIAATHPGTPAPAAMEKAAVKQVARRSVTQFVPQIAAAARPGSGPAWLVGLGTVSPSSTVIVKSQVEGQLLSVAFKEGAQIQQGQLLASIDPRPFQVQLAQAEQAARVRGNTETDQAGIEAAKLQLTYSQIVSPLSGLAGLRLVDAGNIVHPGDTIVIITQTQPIAVLFTIPEDALPRVLARRKEGANPTVEAWNRDNTVKMATGRLTAVDNFIDQTSGMAKLKAEFENKDGALFTNQFVNVRVLLTP